MDLTDYLSVHHFSRQSYCCFMRRYYSGARASIIWYIYLCLTLSWIFTVQPSLLFARVSNSIAGTWGGWRGEGDDGKEKKKKTPVSLNWLGEVIEERLPQCMQKSLIFLFSMVWQLNRLEMTLSISQARKGDTLKLTIIATQGFCSQTHIRARPPARLLLREILQTPFLTAGTLTMALPPEWRGKTKICSWQFVFCFFN